MGMDPIQANRVQVVAVALYYVLRSDTTVDWAYLSEEQKAEWIAYANRKIFDMQSAVDAPA